MHFPAPRIRFEARAICAVGGGEFGAAIDGAAVQNWRLFAADAGSVLSFGKKRSGNRCYLGVRNGFAIDKWLGSRSTNLAGHWGGFQGRKLMAGDRLAFREAPSDVTSPATARISDSLIPTYSTFPTVRVVPGAEFDDLCK